MWGFVVNIVFANFNGYSWHDLIWVREYYVGVVILILFLMVVTICGHCWLII